MFTVFGDGVAEHHLEDSVDDLIFTETKRFHEITRVRITFRHISAAEEIAGLMVADITVNLDEVSFGHGTIMIEAHL